MLQSFCCSKKQSIKVRRPILNKIHDAGIVNKKR